MVECRKTKIKKRKKCNLTQNSYNFTMWRKSKISSFQVSKILIWPYSWNKKHGKFEKFSFTLNFSCFDCIKLWKLKIGRLQGCDFKKIITSYVKKVLFMNVFLFTTWNGLFQYFMPEIQPFWRRQAFQYK